MRTWKVVAGIIQNEEGQLLMLDHKKTNLWTIPLGKVEFGETARQGLVREMKEEVNVEVVQCYIVSKDIFTFNQGPTTTLVYNINYYTGEIHNNEPEKHPEMKWLTLDEIEQLNVTHATQLALDYLCELDHLKRDMTRSAFLDMGDLIKDGVKDGSR